jgi:DNA repair photolyase
MIHEIQAKTLLATVKGHDPFFGLKYNMNLYRGCEHQCIYCDSRSECYQIENFRDVLVKVNAIELLEKELARKRIKGPIGTGSMSDPYTPTELRYNLTGQALQVIARHGFPVHIITKSDLVLKDLETLVEINRVHAAVCFTITTADDDLGKKLEPGAPLVSARLHAMKVLARFGIPVGISLMPVLPYIEDNCDNITSIIEQGAAHGASFIIPAFGMSMRDRQRDYYYTQLDRLFPGLRVKYEQKFGERYSCPANNVQDLTRACTTACTRYGLSVGIKDFKIESQEKQLPLF